MNQPGHALVLAAATATNRHMRQIILPPQDQPWLKEAVQHAHGQLSKGAAANAWAQGETMTLKEAVTYARALSD